jgi:hypothetical protein
MDGQALQQRLKTLKLEIAAIQEAEAQYKLRRTHSPIDKASHEARRTALEAIKVELASLLPVRDKHGQTTLEPS